MCYPLTSALSLKMLSSTRHTVKRGYMSALFRKLQNVFCKHSTLEGKAREGWIKGRKLSDNRRMRFHWPTKPHRKVPNVPQPVGTGHRSMQIVTLIQAGQPIFGENIAQLPFHVPLWLRLGLGSAPPYQRVQSERGPSQARRRHRNKFAAFLETLMTWA